MGASNASIPYDINVSNFVSVRLSDKQNYVLWKAQMLCLLRSINIRGILDGSFVGPIDSGIETVKQYDNLVRGWIFGSISQDVLVEVFDLDSAEAVWEKLQAKYDPALQEGYEGQLSFGSGSAYASDIHDSPSSLPQFTNPAINKQDSNIIELGRPKLYKRRFLDEDSDEESVPTKTEKKEEDDVNRWLLKHTENGNWSSVETVLLSDRKLATIPIKKDGSNMLHVAVGMGHNDFVKKLLPYLDDEDILLQRDSDGSTALHIASIVGNKDAAELLVKRNKKLVRIEDNQDKEPLLTAYDKLNLETIEYLLKASARELKTEKKPSSVGVHVLLNAVASQQYSLASTLMGYFSDSPARNEEVLLAIAISFPSDLNYVEALVYPYFYDEGWLTIKLEVSRFKYRVSKLVVFSRCSFFGKEATDEHVLYPLLHAVSVLLSWAFLIIIFPILIIRLSFILLYPYCWRGLNILAVPPIKHIENKKRKWLEATMLLSLVCDKIDSKGRPNYYDRPILAAACQNAYRVVQEILLRSPESIISTDKNGHDIIQLAIIHRSEKVYNLIYDFGEHRNLYRTIRDSYDNNTLHLAGTLAPSNVLSQRTGAALQLQRELQWREEVKKLVFPTYATHKNKDNETPDMVFTREHKDLLKEGEQWMKTTAESCSITAALITTIVFAAAITVPGGSDQEKGTPLFKKEIAFIIFAISDAISLFASSTALLVFLSILTTRFAEKDFLVSLPTRLFIGLFSLLLSTTTMMVAFSATLFLVFCDKKLWVLAPICGLALIPIASFVTLQFPLMVDLFSSTYLPIFGKERQSDYITEMKDMLTEKELLSVIKRRAATSPSV